MKYVFSINQALSVCRSKEFDIAGDAIIDCFREALGEEYHDKIAIDIDHSHDNPWYHKFVVQIDCDLSRVQIGKVDFSLFESGLNFEKMD